MSVYRVEPMARATRSIHRRAREPSEDAVRANEEQPDDIVTEAGEEQQEQGEGADLEHERQLASQPGLVVGSRRDDGRAGFACCLLGARVKSRNERNACQATVPATAPTTSQGTPFDGPGFPKTGRIHQISPSTTAIPVRASTSRADECASHKSASVRDMASTSDAGLEKCSNRVLRGGVAGHEGIGASAERSKVRAGGLRRLFGYGWRSGQTNARATVGLYR